MNFSLAGGRALGCASGRFGVETTAHMSCQRERQGLTRRRGTVVSSALADRREEQEREWWVEERDSASFYIVSLKAGEQRELLCLSQSRIKMVVSCPVCC